MSDSILDSIKKVVGFEPDYEAFDQDIIMHINTVFFTLHQLGVGPTVPFSIVDNATTWEEFIGDAVNLQAVKSYTYMKVRLMFDPPATSYAISAMEKMCLEYEWRLYVQVDPKKVDLKEVNDG